MQQRHITPPAPLRKHQEGWPGDRHPEPVKRPVPRCSGSRFLLLAYAVSLRTHPIQHRQRFGGAGQGCYSLLRSAFNHDRICATSSRSPGQQGTLPMAVLCSGLRQPMANTCAGWRTSPRRSCGYERCHPRQGAVVDGFTGMIRQLAHLHVSAARIRSNVLQRLAPSSDGRRRRILFQSRPL